MPVAYKKKTTDLIIMEDDRLKTFADWPHETPSGEQMAEAGLYFTGANDTVKCPFCMIKLNSWTPEDHPRERHAELCPECPFIKLGKKEGQIKVEEFIDLLKEIALKKLEDQFQKLFESI